MPEHGPQTDSLPPETDLAKTEAGSDTPPAATKTSREKPPARPGD
jgi:hypothetical protein